MPIDPKSSAPARRPGGFSLAALLALLAASGLAEAAPAAPARPDLVLITLDTTRVDQLGCYGAAGAGTPTLDGLAASGIRFASAWSPVPLTLPAHATLLTGLEPAEHGLRDNGWGRLEAKHPLLAESLRRAGYHTAAFPASRVLDARFGLDRGFDLYDDRMAAERIGLFGYAERPAAEVVDAALAWLATAPRDRPLFLWVHFYDPHAPYEPPAELAGGGTPRALYGGEIAYVDRELGRLLAAWPAGRKRVVAAVADHGEAFGEHGETGHGLLLYQPTLQVPLLLAGDGVAQGKVVHAPVAIRRLAATLLEVVGLPASLPGPPLPLIAEPREPSPIFHETLFPGSAYGWRPLAAITQGPTRVIAAPRPEVYDLEADPGELDNRLARASSGERRVQRQLAEHLRRHPLDATPPAVDAETAAALRSLGYLSGQSRRFGELDPKDGVTLLAELEAANTAAAAGDLPGAEAKLTALVARSPQSVPFLSRLAGIQAERGQHAAALATLDRALAQSPQLDFLHFDRGECLLALGRASEAAAAFRLALDLHPRLANAWLRLAEIELRAGRPAAEKKLLQEAVAAGTSSAVIAARLGEIALRRGDLAAADRHLADATSLLPTWPAPWRLWAEVARRQNKPELAAERERRGGAGSS